MEIKLFNRIIYINKEIIVVTVLFLVAISVTAGYLFSKELRDTMVFEKQEAKNMYEAEFLPGDGANMVTSGKDNYSHKGGESQEGQDNHENNIEEENKIHVYVTGCVNNPGIVTLKKGQLIYDAIIAAGGATSDADLENINLVYKLESNAMLYIRSKMESAESGEPEEKAGGRKGIPSGQGEAGPGQGEAGPGIKIVYDSGGAVVYEERAKTDTGGKVNINTADINQLKTLPGIGEATAKDIIEYREKNGRFNKIEDIMKVPGIKEGRFNNIKDYIVVD